MNRRSRGLRWKVILGWLAVNGWVAAQAGVVERQPLSRVLVVQALHVKGIEVDAAMVHMPMLLDGVGSSPTLEVMDADREAGGQLRVRLRCVKISDCVAFTATLDIYDQKADAVLELLKSRVALSPQRDGTVRPALGVLHAGDRVVLSLEQEHTLMQMPCLAIDTGYVGEIIRVSTLDRRKTFRAVVLDPERAKVIAE